MDEVVTSEQTRCLIVGGGPAGCVLALLLARGGVPVTLLESHADFDRDFRGDTIHPSTLELMETLGLAERLHAFPHGKIRVMRLRTPDGDVTMADLARLRTRFPYVMTLPQARFLELLAAEAGEYPDFRLVMQAHVSRLVEENGAVVGVRYRDAENQFHEVRAPLTVAADGRFSKLRHLAGIETIGTAPPMDVVWFRLSKRSDDPGEGAEIYVGGGRMAVILDRGDQWQIGFVISKGTYGSVRSGGIDPLRNDLLRLIPWLADRAAELTDWKQTTVLNVESSRATTWHKPGLLLIGDAAHAMSPVGGVGINVAIQDAIAAANRLTEPLRGGTVTEADLAAVQADRESAVIAVQRLQRVIQNRIAAPGLSGKRFKLPWFMRLALSIPGLRDIPGRMMAFGPRRVVWRKELDRGSKR